MGDLLFSRRDDEDGYLPVKAGASKDVEATKDAMATALIDTSPWQPIRTVPKRNQDLVDLWYKTWDHEKDVFKYGRVTDAFWEGSFATGRWARGGRDAMPEGVHYTHWMKSVEGPKS